MNFTFKRTITLPFNPEPLLSVLRILWGVIVVLSCAGGWAAYYAAREMYDLSKSDGFTTELAHYGIQQDAGNLFSLGYTAGVVSLLGIYVGITCTLSIIGTIVDMARAHKKARVSGQ